MANPTEITITNLVEMTNITEITNTIIEVLDKIDIVDITQPIIWYENLTLWGMVATVVSAFLMWLSVSEMKKQHEDEKEERVRESIQKFIDTYLTIPTSNELVKYSDEKKRDFFLQYINKINSARDEDIIY